MIQPLQLISNDNLFFYQNYSKLNIRSTLDDCQTSWMTQSDSILKSKAHDKHMSWYVPDQLDCV